MYRIFLIHQNTCQILEIEKDLIYEDIEFGIKKNKLSICIFGYSSLLKSKQFTKIRGYIIGFCITIGEVWNLFKCNDVIHIGRNKTNTIQIEEKMVSNIHCMIKKEENQYWIYDKKSTNGVFLNGEKIDKSVLRDGDQIVVGCTILYYVKNHLILNHKVDAVKRIKPSLHDKAIEKSKTFNRRLVDLTMVLYEIESPIIFEDIKKPGLFTSIGSSLMILVSSFLTGFMVLVFTDSSLDSMTSMMFSSISMCLAFLSYGMINRQIMYKTQVHAKKNKENLYIAYLDNLYQLIKEDCKKVNQQIEKNENFFVSLDMGSFNYFQVAPFMLMLTHEKYRWCEFKFQKANYQDQNHFLYKKRDELLSSNLGYVKNIKLLRQNDRIWIRSLPDSSVINTLWQQICWFCNDLTLKVLWLVNEHKEAIPYTDHPFCRINNIPLVATTDQECIEISRYINQTEEIICFVLNSSLLSNFTYEEKTLIYISNKTVDFEFDYVIDTVYENNVDIQNIRRSIYYHLQKENQTRNFIDVDGFDLDLLWDHKETRLDFEIGSDDKYQPICLDLREIHQGPHGLIAGMTGSGKSEFISTMLMQLIIHNPPSLLQYVLVDFKGEAFGTAFRQFDHCAGIVSNLSHNSMERFSLSMAYEIRKRQKLLKEMLVKNPARSAHVDVYNKIYSENPISHLFVIVDEFAQLKAHFPEHLKSMIEMARIGRSLGIHLILSTQKPLGIIDEQIWANTNLKVCLKVNSETDSREILHHTKAAYLKDAGEFIVQVMSSQYEKKGKAFYLHDEIRKQNTYLIQKESGKLLFQSQQRHGQTVYEFLMEQILKRNKQRAFIVLPGLLEQKDFTDGLIRIDLPHIQSQVSLDIVSNTIILTNEADFVICSIVSRYQKKSIYLCGFDGYDDYVDETILLKDLLWKKDYIDKNAYLIIRGCDFYSVQDFHCHLIVIIDQCSHQIHDKLSQFDLLMSYKVQDLESHRYFFDSFKITKENLCLVLYDGKLCEYLFCQDKRKKKTEKKKIKYHTRNDMLIGLDVNNGFPYFWNRKRSLVFCFIQNSVKENVLLIVERWKKIDISIQLSFTLKNSADVYILYVPEIMQDEFIIKQYDMDIVWVGLGFMEYSYLIKRMIPHDSCGEMIYWHENETHSLVFEKNDEEEICMNN